MGAEKIKPVRQFSLETVCPPDKSITHRALIFSAIACGTSVIRNISHCDDCITTLQCVRRLGADVRIDGDTAYVVGTDELRSGEIYTDNSGTTMRLLCGLLAPCDGLWEISGDKSLSRRPMDRVIEPLTLMGGDIMSEEGKAPLWIVGSRLSPITYQLPVPSAQVKSAVILAALGAEGETVIIEPVPTRDHTEIMLKNMGADISKSGDEISVRGRAVLSPLDTTVVGDISSAAYPLVLGLITGGSVTVRGVGLNPTRTGILGVFDSVGVDYEVTVDKEISGEKCGSITVRGAGKARPFKIARESIPLLIDEIPVLAVMACYLSGDSVIEGAGELRHKESDRFNMVVELIKSFGGDVEVCGDDIIIHPRTLVGGCAFDPQGDHRMAMTAAVALAASELGGEVLSSECVNISYPDFWQMMSKGGAK